MNIIIKNGLFDESKYEIDHITPYCLNPNDKIENLH